MKIPINKDLITVTTNRQSNNIRCGGSECGVPRGGDKEVAEFNAAFPDLDPNIEYKGYQFINNKLDTKIPIKIGDTEYRARLVSHSFEYLFDNTFIGVKLLSEVEDTEESILITIQPKNGKLSLKTMGLLLSDLEKRKVTSTEPDNEGTIQ